MTEVRIFFKIHFDVILNFLNIYKHNNVNNVNTCFMSFLISYQPFPKFVETARSNLQKFFDVPVC